MASWACCKVNQCMRRETEAERENPLSLSYYLWFHPFSVVASYCPCGFTNLNDRLPITEATYLHLIQPKYFCTCNKHLCFSVVACFGLCRDITKTNLNLNWSQIYLISPYLIFAKENYPYWLTDIFAIQLVIPHNYMRQKSNRDGYTELNSC